MAGVFKNKAKRDKLLEAAFRRELTQNPNDALLIAQAAIARAKCGDITAAVFIRDTVDGKPHQSVDIEHSNVDAVRLMDEEELVAAVRKRMGGLRPKSPVGVEEVRGPGSGGDQKTH